MTVRNESLVMLAVAGVTGVVFLWTRGFWSAAPLLVIAVTGAFFHLMAPVPKEQPGRVLWANLNLLALILTLAATWYESPVMLLAGVLMVVVTLAVPRLQRKD